MNAYLDFVRAALRRDDVRDVAVRANSAFNSHIVHLVLSYADDAPADAPRRLLLKRNLDAEWAVRAGAREAGFYRLVGSLPERPPMLVACYDAHYDESSGQSHVLLHDHSPTHRAPLTRDQQLTPGRNVPSDEHTRAVVAALAGLHACWWKHPLLAAGEIPGGEWRATEAGYTREIERRSAAWSELLQAESSWFPAHERRLVDDALAGLPRVWTRYLRPRLARARRLTLVHGDAYFANFLCPIDGRGDTYLIDWQSYEVGCGADDLVNLCATFWTPEQRGEGGREQGVLRHYFDELTARGVAGFSREQLELDYRLALVDWLFVPIIDRADGSPASYWWPKLRNLAAAYREWGCDELLD